MKSKFRLVNLDCANCAAKIEQHLKKQSWTGDAIVNFATMTLFTNSSDLEKIRHEIKTIEPEIDIQPLQNGSNEPLTEEAFKPRRQIVVITISLFLLATVLFFESKFQMYNLEILEYGIAITAYLLSGWSVLRNALKTIRDKQWFNEHVLMVIATIGAFAIHAMEEAVGVMIFYQIGELLQNLAVSSSRKSISTLLKIRPDFANIKKETSIKQVSPDTVNPGDIIVVKAGEKIPLDGIVIEGNSQVNTAVLTGESVPQSVKVDDQVLAGELNLTGMLTVMVTKRFSESSVSRILDLVENAASKKAKTEQFMTTFARFYTPFVVFSALLIAVLPPLFFPDQTFATWIYRALVLLVISCPCALIISIPLGYFGGIGGASKKGILVKGSNFLDALSKLKSVVFDKTGTLTKGDFSVKKIVSTENYTEEYVLQCAAIAEYHSNHPIAQSIVKEFTDKGGFVNFSNISDHQELSGYGVIVNYNNNTIVAGNDYLLHKEGIAHNICETGGSVVHVASNGEYLGYLHVGDEIKDDAIQAVQSLRKAGIKDIIMLTGDNHDAASSVANQLNIDKYYASLLPEQKVRRFEAILKEKPYDGLVAFVGDGINDAPVLARADLSIAMGGLGSEAAIETADVVLMTDHPSKIAQAIKIGKRTRNIVLQNIIMALGIKLIFVALGSIGLATMWEAVFADMGVALMAVVNSSRALAVKNI